MGRPDQGNKAQTPLGYSHETGVSNGGRVIPVTGVHPQVTLGVEWILMFPCASPTGIGRGLRVAAGRVGGTWV